MSALSKKIFGEQLIHSITFLSSKKVSEISPQVQVYKRSPIPNSQKTVSKLAFLFATNTVDEKILLQIRPNFDATIVRPEIFSRILFSIMQLNSSSLKRQKKFSKKAKIRRLFDLISDQCYLRDLFNSYRNNSQEG